MTLIVYLLQFLIGIQFYLFIYFTFAFQKTFIYFSPKRFGFYEAIFKISFAFY